MDGITDLKAERAKFLPKGVSMEGDGQPVNGGIGDGRNDGGPAYCIDIDNDADDTA